MLSYTIDDHILDPLFSSIEVTIAFPSEKRWLFFVTPDLLNRVGDFVEGSSARVLFGERHMIIVSELSPTIIESVIRQLEREGELKNRTLAL